MIRIFRSFAEANNADFEYYQSLTPEPRLDVFGELISLAQPDETKRRLKRVCRVIKLQEEQAPAGRRCAVAYRGLPRYTEDMDFLIEASPQNAMFVAQAFQT